MSTYTVYKLDDRINFGKHKGKLVITLVDEDPEYLIWAHENVAFFKLDTAIFKMLKEEDAKENQDDQDDEDDDLLK